MIALSLQGGVRHTVRRAACVAAFLLGSLACTGQGQPADRPVAGSTAVQAEPRPWPTQGWQVSTPEARHLDPVPLAALDDSIRAGRSGYVDRLLIIQGGYVVLSARYPHDYVAAAKGQDLTPHQYNYYHPDWHPYFQGGDLHTLQSITKSITSALIGIAIGRGEIAGVDAQLLPFLASYDLSRVDPRLRTASLEDLLTMRTGIEWHESDRPADSTNTTIRLEGSRDWIQFTLDQPMDAAPGEEWAYNSGTSHLMSAILRSATGLTADRYAETHLFQPLGIDAYHWKRTPRGLPDTEGGLYLGAEQLAKIGYLYLNDGVWDGRRILPEGWVRSSVQRHVESVNQAGWGYGYQWWRIDQRGVEIWAGLGYGGQYLVIMPSLDMIAVVNGWNLFGRVPRPVLLPTVNAMIDAAARR